MTFTLVALALLTAIEVLVWLPPLWRMRRWLLCGLIPLLALMSGLLFGQHPVMWTALITLLSIYRLANLLRILENRLQAKQLYAVTRRTACLLITSQLLIGALAFLGRHANISSTNWAYLLGAAQLVSAGVLLASTRRHLRTTRPPTQLKNLTDHELPTLSVLIPARNETADLEACLQSLVSSNYPKLEILVLDDCSQNKHTPAIIKDYAHAGVRFLAGEAPPKHWLAKNYAYHQLAERANGEILLFCGVDTRFEPGSLRTMIEVMRVKQKYMLSWIPRNLVPRRRDVVSLPVQPARYAWELSLPRRLFRRPPVLSTCWLITADELRHAGGFAAVASSISMESFFAKHAIGHDDGYAFLQSDAKTGLVSAKSPTEQRATAVRVRYPQLHRRPELVALVSLAQFSVLVGPFALFVVGVCGSSIGLTVLGGLSAILAASSFALIVTLTYRRFRWAGVWLLPFAALYDIGLLNYSMWRYEFREVVWKGRNICVPIAQTISDSARKS
jgi:hypothetical protein